MNCVKGKEPCRQPFSAARFSSPPGVVGCVVSPCSFLLYHRACMPRNYQPFSKEAMNSYKRSKPFKTTPSHATQPTKPAEVVSVQAKECEPKLNQPSQLNARVNHSKYDEKSRRAPQLKNKIFEQKRIKTWHFLFL